MKPLVKDETLMKMQAVIGEKPITRGFDEKLNECLDELEDLRKKRENPQVMSCERMEELTNG